MSFNFFISSKNDDKFLDMKDFFNEVTNIKTARGYKIIDESPINSEMDIFLICLLIGINHNLTEEINNYEKREFSKSYIQSYDNYSTIINAIFLSRCVLNQVNEFKNKEKVRAIIKKLIDPSDRKNELTPVALNLMNSFALGGYIKLLKEFNYKPPTDISVLMVKFFELIKVN